jgi:RNA recognition motif-containing protein
VKKLYVGGIAYRASDDDLRAHFSQAGTVESATILMERDNPTRSRGFGFVEMSTPEEAQKAIEMLDRSELNGRSISVKLAYDREDRPRGNGGGYSNGNAA